MQIIKIKIFFYSIFRSLIVLLSLLAVIISSAYSIELHCKKKVKKDLCFSSNFIIKDNKTTIELKTDKKIDDISTLFFKDAEVNYLPVGISKEFSKLKIIKVVSSSLIEIKKSDFEGLKNVIEVNFERNSITKLPNDLLQLLESLSKINLNHNNISAIPAQLFINNLELTVISFVGNRIVMINEQTFKNLVNLKHIDLSNNLIEDLRDGTFDDCTELKEISIANNKLKYAPESIFDKNTELIFKMKYFENNMCIDSFLESSTIDNIKDLKNAIRDNCKPPNQGIIEELRRKIKKLEKSNEKLEQEKNDEIKNLEKKLKDSKEELTKAENKLNSTMAELDAKKQELEKLQQDKNETDSKVSLAENGILEMNKTIAELTENLENSTMNSLKCQSDLADLEAKNLDLQKDLKNSQSNLKNCNDVYSQTLKDFGMKFINDTKFAIQIENLTAKLENLQKVLDNKTETIADYENKIQNASKTLEENEATIQNLKSNFTTSNEKIAILEKDLSTLALKSLNYHSKIEGHETTNSKLTTELESLKKLHQECMNASKLAYDKHAIDSTQISTFEAINQNLTAELSVLKVQVAEKDEIIAKNHKTIQELDSNLETYKVANQFYKTASSKTIDEFKRILKAEEMTNKSNDTNSSISTCESQLKALKTANLDLQTKLGSSTTPNQECKNDSIKIGNFESTNQNLTAELDSLRLQIADKDRIIDNNSQTIQNSEKALNSCKMEINALKNGYKEANLTIEELNSTSCNSKALTPIAVPESFNFYNIDCKFEENSNRNDNFYTCSVNDVRAVDCNAKLKEISSSTNGKTVTGISISDSFFIDFPTDLAKKFKDFKFLKITKSIFGKFAENICELSNEIEVLSMTSSNVGDSIKLDQCKALKTLLIESSGIKSISAANPIKSLSSIVLKGNKIEEISKEFFDKFENLKSVQMPENKITSLSGNTFDGNKLLETVNLSKNPIKKINGEIFSQNSKLVSIDFNQLECIKKAEYNKKKIDAMKKDIMAKCG